VGWWAESYSQKVAIGFGGIQGEAVWNGIAHGFSHLIYTKTTKQKKT